MFETALSYAFPIVMGVVVYYLGVAVRYVYNVVRQRSTVSFDLHSYDVAAWEWFLDWLEHDAASLMVRGVHHVRLRPNVSDGKIGFTLNDYSEPIRFRFEGHVVRLLLNLPATSSFVQPDRENASRSVTFWAYAKDTEIFRRLLNEMRTSYNRRLGTDTRVYVPTEANFERALVWKHLRSAPPRPMRTVIMPETIQAQVLSELAWFTRPATRNEYVRNHSPYRRTWMLTGPPGSGKSSLIMATAAHLGLPVHFMTLSHQMMDDRHLMFLLNPMPETIAKGSMRLVVLEDIDVLFPNRDKEATAPTGEPRQALHRGNEIAYQSPTRVTQSGFLNVLDGPCAPTDIFIIMTTNHPEHLDPAMYRPGRVDCIFELGAPDEDRIRRYFIMANGGTAETADVDAFVRICNKDFEESSQLRSMARVRELAMVQTQRART